MINWLECVLSKMTEPVRTEGESEMIDIYFGTRRVEYVIRVTLVDLRVAFGLKRENEISVKLFLIQRHFKIFKSSS